MTRFLTFILGAVSAFYPSYARAQDNPVVVELFTSQGCSSCPAADQVLKDISTYKNLITLSCHVTYWDYLGWTDTLSRDFCTERQRGYATQTASHRVYTPQMIINGRSEFVGSRRSEAVGKIARAQKEETVLPIAISSKNAGTIIVDLPALPQGGQYVLRAFGYKSTHTQKIGGGENSGRTVHYTNAILFQTLPEDWDGRPGPRELAIPEGQGTDSLAIIAQDGLYGPILAAGKLEP